MFKGQYKHNLDDKGRLVMPSKFRNEISSGAVITIGFEGCLTIYTAEGWKQCVNELLSKPMTNVAVRKTMRVLQGNASDVELDKSGRMNIPDYLLSAAGISKDVTIVGLGSVIEVWATQRWLKEQDSDMNEFESFAEQLYYLDKEK
ncbi:MAG: division/cell wall cluster transcriptional repressor MraZ [Erysipelotrichaceae bacterium]|nr:division/cell wall cluster transcriptional repressor MraZ [Erysipelotrichaceae bacterium]